MSRIRFLVGELTREEADALAPPPPGASGEESLRARARRSLELAEERGGKSAALPALAAGALPLQRRAEILLEVARAHLAGGTSLEEIRFVLPDEPSLRVFEMVDDSARVAEQMRRMRKRRAR
jgi:O-acetyl-ADP-ribose deacetylase (regulator of RNase III)